MSQTAQLLAKLKRPISTVQREGTRMKLSETKQMHWKREETMIRRDGALDCMYCYNDLSRILKMHALRYNLSN